jgi:phosphoribosylformimino-5-aminoimidazole carboxamide ribotide isomerase
MQVIPAIDLRNGRCVRLRQGEFTHIETYSEDPVKYAQRWQQEGATRLHIVDLDGARVGMPQPQNLDVIRQILRRIRIPIQLGGGIRNAEIAERMFRIGVDRVVIGTSAAQNAQIAQDVLRQFGDRVIIGIDARDGFVAVSGWMERLDESAVSFARRMEKMGAKRIIFTDIRRDGMLSGVNIAALQEILDAVSVPVIASGGVCSIEDIRKLVAMGAPNLEGVIVGKALYAGKMNLSEAIAAAIISAEE